MKLGILGCGGFIVRRILPFLKEMESIQVVCIQNRNREKGEEIARRFDIPRAVSTVEDLLDDPNVEAVHIASPNFLHEKEALACAAAGKPTLCEKPLSISVASIDRMVESFRGRSIPFFVGHQLRFKPAVQKARELYLTGALGTLLHCRAYFYSQSIPEQNWRLQPGNGGGVLQEIGVHLIDLIHFISGEQILDGRALAFPTEVDKRVSLQGRLPKGALVSIECSYERPFYNGFELIGTESRLVSSGSLRQTDNPIESLRLIPNTGSEIDYPLNPVNVYVEEYKHFAQAVLQGIDSPIRAEISRSTQSVIDEAYGSLLRV